jgi:hypothetical protein
LLRTLLTAVVTGNAFSTPSGQGCNNERSPLFSQRSKSEGARMTGIRVCKPVMNSFAAVVRMEQDSTGSGPFSHRSHSPAKTSGLLSTLVMKYGCFLPALPVHSKKPAAGNRQRLCLKADRKEGFSGAVSARALMSLEPMARSSAQEGMCQPYYT